MNTHGTSPRTPDDLADEIAAHVARYRPRLLSGSQSEALLAEIRSAVLRAEPPTVSVAGNWLSILCRYVADVAPSVETRLSHVLTPVKVAAWVASSTQRGQSPHTMHTRRGILERILRTSAGLPPTLAATQARPLAAPPLTEFDLMRLAQACVASSPRLARVFAAAFGTGRSDSTLIDAQLGCSGPHVELVLASGEHVAVVRAAWEMVGGVEGTLCDGDWSQLRSLAATLGIFLDATVTVQTYRLLAMTRVSSVVDLFENFRLSEIAVTDIAPYLNKTDLADPAITALFRGDGLAVAPKVPSAAACAPKTHSRHSRLDSTPAESEPENSRMSTRASGARARRLAAEARQRAAQYPEIPPAIERYITEYSPRRVDATAWAAIKPTFTEVLLRAGFRSDGAIRVHTTALLAYLAWRHDEGLSLAINDAMRDSAIDQYYHRGSSHLNAATRNDYRSRLRTQARRVAPGVHAPVVPSLGHNSVKPGYTSVEEATMRRVALGQPRPETRRRLCAVVGLGGGGGIDPQDLRFLYARDVNVRDDGIHVEVGGARARHVVIRRVYEPLVLAALDGLKPDDLILRLGRDKANPVARAIADAELFDDVPRIDMRRLRTTWITWLLTQPLPLSVVLQASGLTSARTLVDMIRHLELGGDPAALRDGSDQ